MCQISIVVPIYNTARYLRECIESIINQSFTNIEIILVNDGSTDNSLDICYEYKERDSRVIVINQKNSGVAVARNAGLKIATGEYIIFLDSDDIFSNNLLEKLYNQAEKTNADITICRENALYENEPLQKIRWYMDDIASPPCEVFSVKIYSKYILNFCILWPWDKLYRTEFLKRIDAKYPTKRIIEASEDLVFVGRTLVNAERITIVNEYLINHRYHSKSLEATRNKYAATEALKELAALLKKDGLYSTVKQSFINLVMVYLRWHYSIRKDDKQEVEKIVKKAVKKYKLHSYTQDYFYDKWGYECFANVFLRKKSNHIIIKIFGIKISFRGLGGNK